MISVNHKARLIRVCVISISVAPSIAFESMSASSERFSAQVQQSSGALSSAKRMADGKQWTTGNLNVKTVPSYCYEDAESNCRLYGREAHGFYWTASESDGGNAWFYNFGKGRPALYRQSEGEKPRAFSVRCVRE